MSSTRSFASEKERRLNEALAQYLEAEEAGQSPDQAALLARYPDLVSDLNEFFANRAGLASLARPFGGVAADATAAFVSPPPAGGVAGLAAGRRFGDYEILREIARGGMGIVYRARQLSLRREVALKMILAGPTASPATLRRFRIEAEAAAHLDHPHIVPIYDVGEIDGQAYFTMKLVEAGCLASRLDEFRLPLPGAGPRPGRRVLEQEQARLAGLLATVARAVHHAHLRGILHRDLKPANILLDGEGNPLLSDFGLAKRFEQDGQLTGAQTVIGTAAYMAPEQARPGKDGLTTAADVYALGAILYELLTGRPPHVGASFFETLLKVVEEQPVPPRQRNPLAAPDLNAICLKCLAKESGQRYGSAQELAEDLERCRAGEAISLRRQTPAKRAWRWARRNRLAAALLAAVAVLVAVISVGSPIAAWNIAVSRNQADRNAREAEEHARKERAARTAAEQARNVAMTALGAEQRAQAQNHRLLVSGYVANGTRSLDGGDLFGALVWYGEALHLDAGDADREDAHRVRLAAVLRRCPKLVQVWFDNDAVPPAFSPDGRRVLLVQNNRAQVWDVAGGQAVSAPVRHRNKIERATFGPDDRPEADLRGLTQVLSGQKLDSGSGGFEPLETSRMRASWPRLRARYPQEFTLSAR